MNAHGIPPVAGIAVGWLVCGAAFWKGGLSERTVAAAFLIAWAATSILKDRHFAGPQWADLAVDTAALCAFLFVALRSGRYWPLFTSAFQLLAVLTHLASVADRHLSAWAYITANVIWTYLILGSIAVGTWNASRRRGLYPDLSIATPPTAEPGATRR